MHNRKVKLFILIPDGVSLRNFAYTSFYKIAIDRGHEVVFWNNTPFDLEAFGFSQERIIKPKLHWLTTILKSARLRVELDCFGKRTQDPVYKSYVFPLSRSGWKNGLKAFLISLAVFFLNSEKGLAWLRKMIPILEQRTAYYKACKTILKQHQPDLVYCCSQRSVMAIAPLQAAKSLGIHTGCFVYSWDNLPKATLDVTADYYHVWSNHMKLELLFYYPFVESNQVVVTGTPQFEPHYNTDILQTKEMFYQENNLNLGVTYLCYSGDDVTTSPKDPLYLRDVAKAIRYLNTKGHTLGLIFRRCPVDFTNRYDAVIEAYNDVIVPIQPIWKKLGGAWDTILPLPEDVTLLSNLALHTAAVINLGSSMVFDFAIHQKPCLYMNYNYFNDANVPEQGVYVYDYVHFRSKPTDAVVIWLNHPNDIATSIAALLEHPHPTVSAANLWYEKINEHPANFASTRIWDSIETIIKI
ncbi:UDP-glycosyltransferase [Gelidibacter salicanalis]|uniref:UDP-glycosyltransferase n=1 Tax=Gelidibacter salicanalis TaxID=291193 RepID=A0A5C7ABA8_9FLAO|nr:UDP-glycosyltransferase [Gelidibacter salicanalis]TXE05848.1 UDP-glycosyltransferase [Gelidibacter salicanalis]